MIRILSYLNYAIFTAKDLLDQKDHFNQIDTPQTYIIPRSNNEDITSFFKSKPMTDRSLKFDFTQSFNGSIHTIMSDYNGCYDHDSHIILLEDFQKNINLTIDMCDQNISEIITGNYIKMTIKKRVFGSLMIPIKEGIKNDFPEKFSCNENCFSSHFVVVSQINEGQPSIRTSSGLFIHNKPLNDQLIHYLKQKRK